MLPQHLLLCSAPSPHRTVGCPAFSPRLSTPFSPFSPPFLHTLIAIHPLKPNQSALSSTSFLSPSLSFPPLSLFFEIYVDDLSKSNCRVHRPRETPVGPEGHWAAGTTHSSFSRGNSAPHPYYSEPLLHLFKPLTRRHTDVAPHCRAVRGKEHKNAQGDKSVWNDKLPFPLLSSSSDSFFLSVPLLIPLHHAGARVTTTDSYHPCDQRACAHNKHRRILLRVHTTPNPYLRAALTNSFRAFLVVFFFFFVLTSKQIECFPFTSHNRTGCYDRLIDIDLMVSTTV